MGWSWLWNRSGSSAIIESVLPRKGAFVRKAAGEPQQEQIVAANIVHGGTIMALLSHYCGGDYFSYQVKNAEGYHLRLSLQENKMELKEKV